MAVVRWTFEDPNTLDTYTFALNPSDGGSPSFDKVITRQATTAPDGLIISFQGQDQPQVYEFSGTLLTEEQYDAFVEWWGKRYQIKVTDDLGREFWIEIQSFKAQRKRAAFHPWKHTYTITATIVDWP